MHAKVHLWLATDRRLQNMPECHPTSFKLMCVVSILKAWAAPLNIALTGSQLFPAWGYSARPWRFLLSLHQSHLYGPDVTCASEFWWPTTCHASNLGCGRDSWKDRFGAYARPPALDTLLGHRTASKLISRQGFEPCKLSFTPRRQPHWLHSELGLLSAKVSGLVIHPLLIRTSRTFWHRGFSPPLMQTYRPPFRVALVG